MTSRAMAKEVADRSLAVTRLLGVLSARSGAILHLVFFAVPAAARGIDGKAQYIRQNGRPALTTLRRCRPFVL